MKKFISKLFNRSNNVTSVAAVAPVQNKEDEKTSERNKLLAKIFWTAQAEKLPDLEKHVREYLSQYGEMTGEETVWLQFNNGDIYDPCWVWSKKGILAWTNTFTKEFFFAVLNGNKDKAEEWRKKVELQKDLKKVFEAGDVIGVDKALSAGADINYRYFSSEGYTPKLWDNIRYAGKRMYEYFMTREDCPEAMKIKAEKELIASRQKTA